jgi:hypothetical protein
MKAGDLVKSKFPDPNGPWSSKLGTVMELDEMGGTQGAWVQWFSKGLFWSPLHQLEIVNEAG